MVLADESSENFYYYVKVYDTLGGQDDLINMYSNNISKNDKFLDWVISFDKNDHSKWVKDNMIPFEREIYIGLLEQYIKDENERVEKENAKQR